MTNQRARINLSPGLATSTTIQMLSVYEGRAMADITMELVEEAIQARLQQQRIPQAVLTCLNKLLDEKFLDNLHELDSDINSK